MADPATNEKVSSNSCYIPDDISFSILSKLPVKSLKRFCCVNKSWSVLFQNPKFIDMFRNNLISKSHAIYDDACQIVTLYENSTEWSVYLLSGEKFQNKVKLNFPPSSFHIPEDGMNPSSVGFNPFSLLDSGINGIICVSDDRNDTTLLWNPATEEIKVLPPGFAELKDGICTCISLHGFGYDHVTHDYKVIEHVGYDGENPMLDPFWEIYSLRSNSWRKIDFDMSLPTMAWFANNDVYLNGVCHWWGLGNKLVSFNLCNEECIITPSFIEGSPDNFDVVNLNVLNGYVAIITNRRHSTSYQISILGEFGVKESWIKLYVIPRISWTICPIGIGKKGNIFFQTKDDELVCLDLTTGVIEVINLKGSKYSCQVVIYKRNLHPIGEINN
ncbi:F-box/kelch-repeat protein [Trifolium repens]|nr:F-box/kelch-repeat protein [Trifolium repens]